MTIKDGSLPPPLPTHNESKDDSGGKGSQEPLPRLLRREFDQTSATKEKPCEGRSVKGVGGCGGGVWEGGVCVCEGRGAMYESNQIITRSSTTCVKGHHLQHG